MQHAADNACLFELRRLLRLCVGLLLFLAPGVAPGQTIQKLEDSLRHTYFDNFRDKERKRQLCIQLLARAPYNGQGWKGLSGVLPDDSLRTAFDQLIARDTADPRGYYLKGTYGDTDSDSLLEQALVRDPAYKPALDDLGDRYYSRFIEGQEVVLFGCPCNEEEYQDRVKRGGAFLARYLAQEKQTEEKLRRAPALYAPLAERHLWQLWQVDSAERPVLQRALLDVATYLRDTAVINTVSGFQEVIPTDAAHIPTDSPKRYFTVEQLLDTTPGMVRYTVPRLYNYLKLAREARYDQRWYSEPLAAHREPLLTAVQPDTENYRFTWIPSFHYPAVVRLQHVGERTVLHLKFSYVEKHRGKKVKRDTELRCEVGLAEYNQFLQLLREADYFRLPTFGGNAGLDGARWLLEARVGHRYHLVSRWSGGPTTAPCKYLMSLADPVPVIYNRLY